MLRFQAVLVLVSLSPVCRGQLVGDQDLDKAKLKEKAQQELDSKFIKTFFKNLTWILTYPISFFSTYVIKEAVCSTYVIFFPIAFVFV